MKKQTNYAIILVTIALGVLSGCKSRQPVVKDYPIQPVAFNQVKLTDHFWLPRIRLNHELTIPYAFRQSEKTGRIKNFEIAAGWEKGSFCSIYPFDDSDVYKIIEGASYSLQIFPDSALEAYVDELIRKIGAAQEPDGYLYTNRTIMGDSAHPWAGKKRWVNVHKQSHELYNLGHMYEAGVAYYLATGKTSFLDICTKSADLLVKDFGWGKIEDYPGHQEVEIGLVKLYRVTGKKEYLDLAKFFLDVRGPNGEVYNQANKKVVDQTEAVGHAVRANYMYSGMADVAALTGDEAYLNAIGKIWENVVSKKLYITGGVGSNGAGEAYGDNYYLPNMTAYCETCAAVANVFWNFRMFLLHGESKYIDVLERTLYNGLLSGLGLSGDRFFYQNPLKSRGQHERSAWFGCACCPSNLTRFLPSIPGYVYAVKDLDLFVNLFITSETKINLGDQKIAIRQETGYPWKGTIKLVIDPDKSGMFNLKIRIPGWSEDQVVPSDLYQFVDPVTGLVSMKVNDKKRMFSIKDGYAVIHRRWHSGDRVEMTLPMNPRRIRANEQVEADHGCVAVERGPVMYCLEWPDQPDKLVLNTMLADDPGFSYRFKPGLLNGVGTITMNGFLLKTRANGAIEKIPETLTAIPYYAWANRGKGEMTVWIPDRMETATPMPIPTIASRAHVSSSPCKGSLNTVNDQLVPTKSYSKEFGCIHWWPEKNCNEWVQYDFDQPETVSSVDLFWFDDEDLNAGCRVPKSWRLLYRKGDKWIPVKPKGPYLTKKDRFNHLGFKPVTTTGLHLDIRLPDDFSTGVQEWVVK